MTAFGVPLLDLAWWFAVVLCSLLLVTSLAGLVAGLIQRRRDQRAARDLARAARTVAM